MHENRETSSLTGRKGSPGGKGQGRNPIMNGGEESDRAVVPMKSANNEAAKQAGTAERVEGRARTKENTEQERTAPAQNGRVVSLGLNGVREAAQIRRQERFTTLLHHVTVELLRQSYQALSKKAAPGVDGVTWRQYGEGLEERLAELHGRIHRGAYRAQPSRRIYIPKADGRKRPLGIAAMEDKVVQHAVVTILNAVYEVDFREFSYGFRPGRSQHQALEALYVSICRKRVNWILDADIRGFFDRMNHVRTLELVQHRIADKRILRLIRKWLQAGVSEEGEWSETTVGTPQGAVISPLLANVYLHYVFDVWLEAWKKRVATGDVIAVRYADDLVLGFEHRSDAERFLKEFQERLAEYGLDLHPEKTKLIEFGRFAQERRRKRGEGEPEEFAFLGFTHRCGTNKRGYFTIWRHTERKRLEATLQEVKQQLRKRMHESVSKVGEWLQRVVHGFNQYYAVPSNLTNLSRFRQRLYEYWKHVLGRRSQTGRVGVDRMARLAKKYLPQPKILHPYPQVGF